MKKKEKYEHFLVDLRALLRSEDHPLSNLANFCALYASHFNPHWVGFYLVHKEHLVLGPFQGPVACTKISIGKGVCGTSAEKRESIIVPNVHEFKGHIACSALSNSELVVPLINEGECLGVVDIDSIHFNAFDHIDQKFIEQAAELITTIALQEGPLSIQN